MTPPQLISECTPNSNFSTNYEDNENNQDNETIQTMTVKVTTEQANTCSKSSIEKSSGVFMISFEHVSYLVLVFSMSILNMCDCSQGSFFPLKTSKILCFLH